MGNFKLVSRLPECCVSSFQGCVGDLLLPQPKEKKTYTSTLGLGKPEIEVWDCVCCWGYGVCLANFGCIPNCGLQTHHQEEFHERYTFSFAECTCWIMKHHRQGPLLPHQEIKCTATEGQPTRASSVILPNFVHVFRAESTLFQKEIATEWNWTGVFWK